METMIWSTKKGMKVKRNGGNDDMEHKKRDENEENRWKR